MVMKMMMVVASSVMVSGVKQSADCDDPHTSPDTCNAVDTSTGATGRDIFIKLSPTQLENNYFLQHTVGVFVHFLVQAASISIVEEVLRIPKQPQLAKFG